MANIYASAGRLSDTYGVEKLRKQARATKKLASALIEVGDNWSMETSAALERLRLQLEEEGKVPRLDLVVKHRV